jgi:perosamine synthetase
MVPKPEPPMIPLIKPDISFDEVADDIKAILDSGRLTSGKYVETFEREFADYIGVKHAVTTTSATTALHLCLVAFGIGPGDEVLVSDFTFPASGNVIVQTGAVPIMVDCLPDRFDLDLDDARAKVTEKTKAIMIIHPFGQPVSGEEINQFSEDTGLLVLEDAACAIASSTGGFRCGSIGNAAAFSFHPRKILTTGEGGMITTDDDAVIERLTILRTHGGISSNTGMCFVDNGYNYRMTEIQAALGLAQLKRIDAIVDERRRIAGLYLQLLEPLNAVALPLSASEEQCSFQSFVVLLDDDICRDTLIVAMKEDGVEVTLGTYAMHDHLAFKRFGYESGDLPNALSAQNQSLTLPLIAGMQEADVAAVVDILKSNLTQSYQHTGQ